MLFLLPGISNLKYHKLKLWNVLFFQSLPPQATWSFQMLKTILWETCSFISFSQSMLIMCLSVNLVNSTFKLYSETNYYSLFLLSSAHFNVLQDANISPPNYCISILTCHFLLHFLKAHRCSDYVTPLL